MLLLRTEGRFEDAFHTAERARARAFLDQLGNQRVDVRAGADAELLMEEERLRGEIAALEDLLRQEWAKSPNDQGQEVVDSVTAQLEDRRNEYGQLLIQLKLANPEYASLVSVDPLMLEEVQDLLDEQTALVEYFVTAEETLVFVVTRDDLAVVRIEVTREELAAGVTYLRNLIADRHAQAEREQAQALYDLLIRPLLSTPYSSLPRIGLVPHGPLHYLPFAALHDGESYLVQQRALSLLPSASGLRFVLEKRKPEAESLLVLGNPTADLPYAEDEAQAIAALYGVTPLLGREASEAQLRARTPQAGLVHVAAHGSFNPYNPLFSALHLAPDGEHDGRLEVHEVYGLDLSRADLVVLSACDTQLGELSAGDELVGLSRAFIYAGTPSIVASLWPVDDAATAALMERLYGYLRQGYSKAKALRAAQVETMAEQESAYYWAAFSLIGDWGIGEAVEVETEAEAEITPTEVVEAVEVPGEKGGGPGPCCSSAALLVVGLVGAWTGRRFSTWTRKEQAALTR